jgi:Polyketide cyclase / dehydrase and lipid transport/Protein of unknown function (DUF2934)
MGTITHSVEINALLREVYHQWTRFEEFPRFMGGVEEVRREGPNRLFWKAKIAGKEKQWEAEITEQVPDTRIAWRSIDGALNRGAVTFEPLDALQTRVTLTMEYEPEGFIEQAGDVLGLPLGQVAEDLNRFREFMESGRETAAPPHQIEPVDKVDSPLATKQVTNAEENWGVEARRERETLSQRSELPPAAIVTEAIASGMGQIGGGPIGGEGDQSHEKHGTVIADTPQPMAIEGSSIEENTEADRGNARSPSPTYEQIARRAYEIYLARGQQPGDEHEDWLTAEKELTEKFRED